MCVTPSSGVYSVQQILIYQAKLFCINCVTNLVEVESSSDLLLFLLKNTVGKLACTM
jgi:hypothetical protein